jgi:hypothetical protein
MTASAGGTQTLLDLRTSVRQESDTEGDPHVSDTEINGYINTAYLELYALLVSSFGDDYFTVSATFPGDGVTSVYPLPDGALYSAAPAFYKGVMLEANLAGSNPYSWVSLKRFNLREKNRFNPLNQIIMPGYQWPRYRLLGDGVMFWPIPVASINFRLWYAPKLAPLASDASVAKDFSGWLEYVVVDAAMKCVAKQERDVSLLMARKSALLARVEKEAANRDIGEAAEVTMTETEGLGGPFTGGPFGPWA